MEIRYVRKWGDALSQEEIDQIQALCTEVNPDLPHDHVRQNHLAKRRSFFQLAYGPSKLLAVHSCAFGNVHWKGKKFPVLFAALGYKSAQAGAELSKFSDQCNYRVIRQQLGPLWYTRRFAMAFDTYNPKLFDKFRKEMPFFFPQPDGRPQHQMKMLAELIEREFKVEVATPVQEREIEQDHFLVRYDNEFKKISTLWESHFKSRHEETNRFFHETGVLEVDPSGTYCAGQGIFTVGIYSFWPYLWKKISSDQRDRP